MHDDEVIARLRGYAAATTIDDDTAGAHQTLMASAVADPGGVARAVRGLRMRTLVAGGTVVAALLAGTGVATASGSLPDPVQNVAHGALKKVGVKVPKGTPVACEDAANHGQYVRSQPKGGAARSAAAKSDCGKKAKDADADDQSTADEAEDKAKVKADKQKGAPEGKGKPDTTPAAEKNRAGDTPGADKAKADEAPADEADGDGHGKPDDAPGKARADEHKPAGD